MTPVQSTIVVAGGALLQWLFLGGPDDYLTRLADGAAFILGPTVEECRQMAAELRARRAQDKLREAALALAEYECAAHAAYSMKELVGDSSYAEAYRGDAFALREAYRAALAAQESKVTP